MTERTEQQKMGWEVARDLEATKKTIWERMIPEWQQIRAALGGRRGVFRSVSGGVLAGRQPL
jgi:hypothetical protein